MPGPSDRRPHPPVAGVAWVSTGTRHGPGVATLRLMAQPQQSAISLHAEPYRGHRGSALRTWTWMSSDAAGAVVTGALEPWLRQPLIRWADLRQLEDTQREIDELRGESQTAAAAAPNRVEAFVAAMQSQLPALQRPRWIADLPVAVATLVKTTAQMPTAALPAPESPELEPEPEAEPRLAPTPQGGSGKFYLHFHTMPSEGVWQMTSTFGKNDEFCL